MISQRGQLLQSPITIGTITVKVIVISNIADVSPRQDCRKARQAKIPDVRLPGVRTIGARSGAARVWYCGTAVPTTSYR